MEVIDISWQHLPGNKFAKALDAAMASEAGYIILQRVRKKGEDRGNMCNVHYDRDYLLEVLTRKVVEPLSSLGKDGIIEFINLAWDSYESNPLVKSAIEARNN